MKQPNMTMRTNRTSAISFICGLALALIGVLALFPGAASAVKQARIWGVVSDPAGEPIKGVKVTAIDTATDDAVSTVTTKSNGEYSITLLDATRPYIYLLEKKGYVSIKEEVDIDAGSNTQHDFSLSPGGSSGLEVEGKKLSPEVGRAYRAGVTAAQAGDWATAESKFREVVAAKPSLGLAWAALGMVELSQGDAAGALEASGKALELDPQAQRALMVRKEAIKVLVASATQAFQQGESATAKKQLETVLAAAPDSAAAHLQMGFVLANQQETAGAIQHFQRFLELAPPDDPNRVSAEEMVEYLEGQA